MEQQFEQNLLIKIDVQGYEDKVILGGKSTLNQAKLAIIETSFQRLYAEQPLFHTIYQLMVNELGFKYVGSWARQPSPIDGFPFQEDSMFLRY